MPVNSPPFQVHDEIAVAGRGRLRLAQRTPEGLRDVFSARNQRVPDWLATALDPDFGIGETLITEAGWVHVHGKAPSAFQIEPQDNTHGDDERGHGAYSVARHTATPEPAASKEFSPATRKVDIVQGELSDPGLAEDLAAAKAFARHSLAENTRRAYRSDWKAFTDWCRRTGKAALPAAPEDVAAFLANQGRKGLKSNTIARRMAAIRVMHEIKGLPAPQSLPGLPIKAVMSGIRRQQGHKPRKVRALTPPLLLELLQHVPDTLAGSRDRALLLVGFAGAFRRSELVALTVEDIAFHEAGATAIVRRSKGDQDAVGRTVFLARGTRACPVDALRSWLAAADIVEGPIFRRFTGFGGLGDRAITGATVNALIKRYADLAGHDPALFGAHSLRRGWQTAAAAVAAASGRPEDMKAIMDQAGHKSSATTLEYIEAGRGFDRHPGKDLL